ncbi:MAG: F0F1 ATP synthase subunit B [Candidatus Omnitrophica bacterium]|nr:F0F1 ATP synthase subunit B [Candidatus Omnitrophota bacterium]MDD5670216.1 F0F1 ATP synthase subunit B [Candidatus Omnitrophota bacterium]
MEFFKANIIPGEVIVQIIAFLIVFWTLKVFAWKPILKSLAARQNKIKQELDQIEAARHDIEVLKNQYASHLQKIDDEARLKIQDAVEEGRKIAHEIQEKARRDSQSTFEKTKENLELEVDKARIELRREIADLAIMVSEKIVQEKMTDSKQQDKILDMIKELEAASEKKREGLS